MKTTKKSYEVPISKVMEIELRRCIAAVSSGDATTTQEYDLEDGGDGGFVNY